MSRMSLEGSSSIITGGASGIGEASARQLADAGSRGVIADLNEEQAHENMIDIIKLAVHDGDVKKKMMERGDGKH